MNPDASVLGKKDQKKIIKQLTEIRNKLLESSYGFESNRTHIESMLENRASKAINEAINLMKDAEKQKRLF